MTGATLNLAATNGLAASLPTKMALACLVDGPASLRAAVDNGADCVHLRYRLDPRPQDVVSPSLDHSDLGACLRYAKEKNCKTVLVLETGKTVSSGNWQKCRTLIDCAAHAGFDALQLADTGLLLYVASHHPGIARHFRLEEQFPDPAVLRLLRQRYGVGRVVLPRVLSLASLETLAQSKQVELQVCGFGRASSIIEPKTQGAATGSADRDDPARYATGDEAANDLQFNRQRLPGVGTLHLLPQLWALGVRAVTVESGTGNAVHQACITRVWREAMDECQRNPASYTVDPAWIFTLNKATRRFIAL